MSQKILISACLLGQPVRYNGRGLSLESQLLDLWKEKGLLVPICPEVEGGLPTPRPPAEIEPNMAGTDVLDHGARVKDVTGADVTDGFVAGARIAVRAALDAGCRFAILTDGSPSCGSVRIYSGRHDGEKREGIGVVTAALRQAGIEVFAQHQLKELALRLEHRAI
ncbi:MAG TPA: DUF523 domain-containing protein, partial [Rhizobiales bacterium]|nr:DUF523 domain-containing protein [Hyphomicrobiales bacterium]